MCCSEVTHCAAASPCQALRDRNVCDRGSGDASPHAGTNILSGQRGGAREHADVRGYALGRLGRVKKREGVRQLFKSTGILAFWGS